jgi:hypothetical protein
LDLNELIARLRDMLQEIRRTRAEDMIPRYVIFSIAAASMDRNSPDFWTEGLAETLASGKLKIRPFRNRGGYFQIKMLFPKVCFYFLKNQRWKNTTTILLF